MKQENQFKALEKLVVSIGVGKLRNLSQFDEKLLPEIVKEAGQITGQKPVLRGAKKSIAGFKTRTGDTVGLQATLRGTRMRDFIQKLVRVVLPRVKDFRGLELGNIDEHGNLNIGFKEHLVFPEIEAEKSKTAFGLQVTIVPAEKKRKDAIELYRSLGFLFKK